MDQENKTKKVWFVRKLYGWGWTPATWQGWVLILVYVVLLFCIFLGLDQKSYSDSEVLLNFILPAFLLTTLLIYICYKKGEKPRWQWGRRVEDK